jgi:vancomycin resistance protein VanW
MKNQAFFRALLPALLLWQGSLAAQELSRFRCQRPEPVEAGSAANAAIAVDLVNGAVIKPGEVFSFNRMMTPGLDRFVEGTAYASGKVVTSEGGGVCQVSAALYNAALLAGLEVLERNNHSVYDPATAYVPAGRDAAISRSVGADMRFRNSTLAPLTISASADRGAIEVALLGRQKRPRQRWIETSELRRQRHKTSEKFDPGLPAGEKKLLQKGFDGLSVSRQLCRADADGVTQCARLGVDTYMMVNERWAIGPSLPAEAAETP